MPPTPDTPARLRWEAARTWVRVFVITAIFSVLVAAVLSLVVPELGDFRVLVWFSECIGLSIAACSLIVRRLPPVSHWPARRATAVSLVVALPLGYALGYGVAHGVVTGRWALVGPSNTRLVAVTASVLAGSFIAYLVWLRNRLGDEAAARATAEKLAVEAELRMLRAQIEPHMLFNTLANLRSLVDEEPAQAKHMIDLMITYLRGALAGSRADATTLQAEFGQLAAYLEVMALRLGRRLRFELDLPDELAQLPVPAMLLQPLVENALKHGIEPKVGGGSIHVSARRDGGMLALRVADTGVGLAPDRAPGEGRAGRAGNSYGLTHVRERLRALYGGRAGLKLEAQSPAGTVATVRIPP